MLNSKKYIICHLRPDSVVIYVGNVSFHDMQNQNSFTKPYSDETAQMIDQEVRKLIDSQYERAKALLKERKTELHALANALLEKEVLLKSDLVKLIFIKRKIFESINRKRYEIKISYLYNSVKIKIPNTCVFIFPY